MKRCPTCQKTFDDNLRFCQTDGTPLVDDVPTDPYKTMVASKEDIQAALTSQAAQESASSGIVPEDEPLEIPSNPPNATPASEFETKIAGRDVIEIPPLSETPPEPPKFNEPAAPPPSFGSESSPPSPFSAGTPPTPPPPAGNDFPTTPPIPSPFSGMSGAPSSSPSTPNYSEPEPEEPTYFEPEPEPTPSYSQPDPAPPTPFADPSPAAASFNPFGQQASSPSTPPAKQQWDPPGTGGTGMAPPQAPTGQKLNQTMPMVSLITGILGLTLCCGTLIPSVVAIVTGIMGRGKATNQPNMYGGTGLALAGLIMGVVGLLGGLVVLFVFMGPVIALITTAIDNAR